jgi:mono/diheme cytochrome c family protein
MTMHRLIVSLATFSLAVGLGSAALAQPPAKLSPAAEHGRHIFVTYGCYQCHGYQGQGSASAGPKLAPQPLPFDAFANQLRKPRDRMPIYTAKVVSEADLNDMYAFLQAIPKAKAVADIPLLNQ